MPKAATAPGKPAIIGALPPAQRPLVTGCQGREGVGPLFVTVRTAAIDHEDKPGQLPQRGGEDRMTLD
jgi:hypothetical protein